MELGAGEWIALVGLVCVMLANLVYVARLLGANQEIIKTHEKNHETHFKIAEQHGRKLGEHETRISVNERVLQNR